MNEEESFLQAIQARPGDTALRLVYADWLEERGDMRGEFIRVQEEMNGLPVYSDRFAELKRRRNELREQIDAGWRERLGYVPRHRPLFTHLPERRVERWRLVEEFIDTWHKPLKPGDGASEEELRATEESLGFRLPTALREWYALAGKRNEVWSKEDQLFDLSRLVVEYTEYNRHEGALILFMLDQGAEVWGIRQQDLGLEDPPVYRFYQPAQVSPTVTTFAIQVLLHQMDLSAIGAEVALLPNDPLFREVERKFRKSALPEHFFGEDPVRVYEGEDILVETRGDQWLAIAARTEEARQQFSEEFSEELVIQLRWLDYRFPYPAGVRPW